MKKFIKFALLLLMSVIIAGCSSNEETPLPPTATEDIPIIELEGSGSGSVTPILAAIADEFEAATPGYLINVLPGSGTGGGTRGVIDGTLDFAAMSRPPRDSEPGMEFVQFGSSVTAIMAHPDVGVTELTSEQLTDIFTGVITKWSEVGGDDQDIILYVRDPEEGNTVDIREAFIGDDDFASSAQVMPSQTDMNNVVSTVEGAIGYGTWATALALDAGLISLSIDGVDVTNAPEEMTTIMGIGYLTDRSEEFQPFVDWLLSDDGKAALEAVAVVPVE